MGVLAANAPAKGTNLASGNQSGGHDRDRDGAQWWQAATNPLPKTPKASSYKKGGGRGWIRTTVGVSQRVYSASPLAARAPVRRARYIGGTAADSSMLLVPGAG